MGESHSIPGAKTNALILDDNGVRGQVRRDPLDQLGSGVALKCQLYASRSICREEKAERDRRRNCRSPPAAAVAPHLDDAQAANR